MTQMRLIPLKGAVFGSADIRLGAQTELKLKLRKKPVSPVSAYAMAYDASEAAHIREVRLNDALAGSCALADVRGIIAVSKNVIICEGYTDMPSVDIYRCRSEVLSRIEPKTESARTARTMAVTVREKPTNARETIIEAPKRNEPSAAEERVSSQKPEKASESVKSNDTLPAPRVLRAGEASKRRVELTQADNHAQVEANNQADATAGKQSNNGGEVKQQRSAEKQRQSYRGRSAAALNILEQARTLFETLSQSESAAPFAAPDANTMGGSKAMPSKPSVNAKTNAFSAPIEYTAVQNPFPKLFPNSYWKKEQNNPTLYGVAQNRNGRFDVTAVPGRYSRRPPARLAGFNRFIRGADGTGYWVRVKESAPAK